MLELEGHEVKRATNGPDALSMVESFSPDVALIDIPMPGMDGQELTQLLRLRAQCSLTKLVALTVFDAHLVKPLSLNVLAVVLRRQRALAPNS